MKKIIDFYKALPWYFKNIFAYIFIFFLVWMLVFDNNNFFYQWKLSRKINELEEQKDYFAQQIKDVDQMKEDLFSTQEKKEKFAREKYFMKKDNEDVFIIVEKN